MSQVIEIGAILYPKADKVERAMELFTALCEHVKASEPGALTYQSYTTQGEGLEPMIIFLERYENQAALDKHMKGTKMAETFQVVAAEELMAAPHKIFTMSKGPGWVTRD